MVQSLHKMIQAFLSKCQHHSCADGLGDITGVMINSCLVGPLPLRLPAWQRRRSVLMQPRRQRRLQTTDLWQPSRQCSA